MNWGLMGGVYAMLHATHVVADYWFQTDWQAQNKTKRWDALLCHIAVYSLSFAWTGELLWQMAAIPHWKVFALPLVVGIPHGWMDRRKFLTWFCAVTKGWKPEDIPTLPPIQTAVRVHVSTRMDQKFHYFCLMLTAAWLAWAPT